MEDIKPREVAWRFDGRDWVLRCNNNVLAEVQEINGGDFSPILSLKRTLKSGTPKSSLEDGCLWARSSGLRRT